MNSDDRTAAKLIASTFLVLFVVMVVLIIVANIIA